MKNEEFKLPIDGEDFRKSFSWKTFRILSEFIEGFHFIADFKKSVGIFGSARLSPTDLNYKEARKLGNLLAKDNFTVFTGGGGGIMEAANRGAFEANGKSVGMNIKLPEEQVLNNYTNQSINFDYFFTRKVMLSFGRCGYVFFPGGFGTLDEFFEMLTLIQTKKITYHIPIILIGKSYWQPLVNWLEQEVYQKQKGICKKDLKIFELVDSAEQALAIIKKNSCKI